MSDNPTLVERLRESPGIRCCTEAADRIETLERELAERTRERDESRKLVTLADKAIYAKLNGEMMICDDCAEKYFIARHRAQAKDKP